MPSTPGLQELPRNLLQATKYVPWANGRSWVSVWWQLGSGKPIRQKLGTQWEKLNIKVQEIKNYGYLMLLAIISNPISSMPLNARFDVLNPLTQYDAILCHNFTGVKEHVSVDQILWFSSRNNQSTDSCGILLEWKRVRIFCFLGSHHVMRKQRILWLATVTNNQGLYKHQV